VGDAWEEAVMSMMRFSESGSGIAPTRSTGGAPGGAPSRPAESVRPDARGESVPAEDPRGAVGFMVVRRGGGGTGADGEGRGGRGCLWFLKVPFRRELGLCCYVNRGHWWGAVCPGGAAWNDSEGGASYSAAPRAR
jgi:hypothetical protein